MDNNKIIEKLLYIIENSETFKKYKSYKNSLDTEYKIIELKAINTFINELSKLKHCDFSIFIKNLENLEIIELHKDKTLYTLSRLANVYGFYNIKENNIYVRLDNFNIAIFHELLHTASSTYDEKKILSGFNYYNRELKQNISNSLNEGYTQLLTDRYFIKKDSLYKTNKFIAKHLEMIIGKEIMENLYFKADLFGLYSEIEMLNTNIETFKDFLNNIEFVTKYEFKLNPITMYKVRRKMIKINEFLVFTYLEKLKQDNSINEKEKLNKIREYTESLCKTRIAYKDNGPLIDKINLKKLENELENILLNKKQKKLTK